MRLIGLFRFVKFKADFTRFAKLQYYFPIYY